MSGENSVVDADKSPSENNEDMGHVGGKNSYNVSDSSDANNEDKSSNKRKKFDNTPVTGTKFEQSQNKVDDMDDDGKANEQLQSKTVEVNVDDTGNRENKEQLLNKTKNVNTDIGERGELLQNKTVEERDDNMDISERGEQLQSKAVEERVSENEQLQTDKEAGKESKSEQYSTVQVGQPAGIERHSYVPLAVFLQRNNPSCEISQTNTTSLPDPEVDGRSPADGGSDTDENDADESGNNGSSSNNINFEKKLLEEYRLKFNKDGGLINVDVNSEDFKEARFQFNVKDDHNKNQKRYEKIGEIITEIIYERIQNECGLERQYIGKNTKRERSFFFISKELLEENSNPDKLLILIHGSGAVRAGQWARSIIINDKEGMKTGTQLPYIKRAQEEGYQVIVMNTNLNYHRSERYDFEDSQTPEKHAQYIWEKFAKKAKNIAIVAHSYGGVVTARLTQKNQQDFKDKVFAIALTDSVHGGLGDFSRHFFTLRAQNWVTSEEDVGTVLSQSYRWHFNDAKIVSAGHTRHEWTSHASFDSVFTYLATMFDRDRTADNFENDARPSNEKEDNSEGQSDEEMKDVD